MGNAPYLVTIVLDRVYGPRLREALEEGPVWVVDSPVNREVAQKLWNEFPSRDHLNGITVFKGAGAGSEEVLIGEFATIDLHHGIHSADPPYTVIRVIGCYLTSEIETTLSEYGFDSFERIDGGFEAVRPLPQRADR
jgi:hypothetical protein